MQPRTSCSSPITSPSRSFCCRLDFPGRPSPYTPRMAARIARCFSRSFGVRVRRVPRLGRCQPVQPSSPHPSRQARTRSYPPRRPRPPPSALRAHRRQTGRMGVRCQPPPGVYRHQNRGPVFAPAHRIGWKRAGPCAANASRQARERHPASSAAVARLVPSPRGGTANRMFERHAFGTTSSRRPTLARELRERFWSVHKCKLTRGRCRDRPYLVHWSMWTDSTSCRARRTIRSTLDSRVSYMQSKSCAFRCRTD